MVKGKSEFGAESAGKPNYELFIAQCPGGCD